MWDGITEPDCDEENFDLDDIIDFEASFKKAMERKKEQLQCLIEELKELKIQLKTAKAEIEIFLNKNKKNYKLNRLGDYYHKYAKKLPTIYIPVEGRAYEFYTERLITFRSPLEGGPEFFNDGHAYSSQKTLNRCTDVILNRKTNEKQFVAATSLIKLAKLAKVCEGFEVEIEKLNEQVTSIKDSVICEILNNAENKKMASSIYSFAKLNQKKFIADSEDIKYSKVIELFCENKINEPSNA